MISTADTGLQAWRGDSVPTLASAVYSGAGARTEMSVEKFEVEPGKVVELVKVGKDRLRGLSPFAKERTPSFFVDVKAGTWHDFATGKSGVYGAAS